MQQNNEAVERPAVLVRAWGGEPVKLYLHRIENNRCFVGKKDALRPIGMPVDEVFVFDEYRFETLSTAFQQCDARRVGELWANIAVDDFACNRYQDNLDYRHDQESVSGTRSPKECSD